MLLRCIYAIIVTILLIGAAGTPQKAIAQSPDAQRAEIHVDQQLAMANVALEPLGPGDLVFVSVSDCPELTRSYRVSADGDLKLALLHAPIHAQGRNRPISNRRSRRRLSRITFLSIRPCLFPYWNTAASR